MKIHTSAGCYVIRKNKGTYELLVIHRTWEKEQETSWTEIVEGKEISKTIKFKEAFVIPKGHKKENESLEEAALRETTEETGYSDIKIVKFLGFQNYILPLDPPVDKTDNYFLSILQSEDTIEQNLKEWEEESGMKVRWMELSKGFNLLTWENKPEILEQIKEYLKEQSI
jgi:8-oxo-dGTP pyrophosphatase MutT (NUDIX family)